MSRNPETFHTLMYIFSDRGTPKSYRESDVYGVNTYKFTKEVCFFLLTHGTQKCRAWYSFSNS